MKALNLNEDGSVQPGKDDGTLAEDENCEDSSKKQL